MNLSWCLWTLVIFPVVQLIDLCYLFIFRVFDTYGTAVAGVSVLISVLTLPLYFAAEKWQKIERDTQKRLSAKADKIRAVFKGDERHMVLAAYYRQNRYHPIYALRSSFGLLIQIPFFIAAYSYLSELEVLRGASFLFIKDLGAPDALLAAGNRSINILPVIMTAINCAAGAIYTKGFPLKEKIQLYGMAFIFLVLLYNSASALVLYWTLNNVFSLVKNILQKTKHPKKIIYLALCVFFAFRDYFLVFIHSGYILKRVLVLILSLPFFFLPFFAGPVRRFARNRPALSGTVIERDRTFYLAVTVLFLLTGLVIPGSLIASSAQEFSFIESHASPFPFIANTALQAAGLFLFWPLCIYCFFSGRVRLFLSLFFTVFSFAALVNTFVFPGDYGFITTTLVLSNPGTFMSDYRGIFINIIVLAGVICLSVFLLLSRQKIFFYSLQLIMVLALFGFSVINSVRIGIDYSKIAETAEPEIHADIPEPVYRFTETGKNVLVVMLDRAISAFVPYIFDEKPGLESAFSGFTWYPNCVSFGKFTIFGAPALFGGYEYTPLEIQRRSGETLVDKHNEALGVLPRLFADEGFSVTVTDPSWANYSWKPDLRIFDKYPAIHAENIIGKYSSLWFKKHPEAQIRSVSEILTKNLIRFSFFKTAPPVIRTFIFDRGKWLQSSELINDIIESSGELTLSVINEYSSLDFLPRITIADSGAKNSFIFLTSQLTHEPAFYQAPDYTPRRTVTNMGEGPFAGEKHYHADMAAFLLLGKWFDYLKENRVYDNTRIIIVSDHGWNLKSDFAGNITLPNGESLQTYNALLMMKDFDSAGDIRTDAAFMTNADVPLLAVEGFLKNPVNPFTNNRLGPEKDSGVTITTSNKLHPTDHRKHTFKIENDTWLHVRDNIFNPDNWEKAIK
ncbi:MAG: YidC/Oxa1 family membrane protein insertase [Treponema sp.]|jgi:YidC/Oxa1 family membrane protein insertase|nr:YidC/Oxa1 family membrane protein insertase [Treponema sp.]